MQVSCDPPPVIAACRCSMLYGVLTVPSGHSKHKVCPNLATTPRCAGPVRSCLSRRQACFCPVPSHRWYVIQCGICSFWVPRRFWRQPSWLCSARDSMRRPRRELFVAHLAYLHPDGSSARSCRSSPWVHVRHLHQMNMGGLGSRCVMRARRRADVPPVLA